MTSRMRTLARSLEIGIWKSDAFFLIRDNFRALCICGRERIRSAVPCGAAYAGFGVSKRPSSVCRTGTPSERLKPARRCHVEDRPPSDTPYLLACLKEIVKATAWKMPPVHRVIEENWYLLIPIVLTWSRFRRVNLEMTEAEGILLLFLILVTVLQVTRDVTQVS